MLTSLLIPVLYDLVDGARTVIVRTGDFGSYRFCRRAWNWGSGIRGGRRKPEQALPLWTGTGIHFALEDYHGYQKYESLEAAWDAYVEATRKVDRLTRRRRKSPHIPMPEDWEVDNELARGMLNYYELWLKDRDPLETLWVDGEPQVEARFFIDLNWPEGDHGIDRVIHQFTIDRVTIDEDDFLWPVDYKSAARYEDKHLLNDSQVTSYCWGIRSRYQQPTAGFVYQQHIKTVPQPPAILGKGTISANKAQNTTSLLYEQSLLNIYGKLSKAPDANVRCLEYLLSQEGEERDKYIKRDRVARSDACLTNHYNNVMLQLDEMLDPKLQIYPSPSKACAWCDFLLPCVGYDDGDDWQHLLETSTINRTEEMHPWREHLPK